jgi:hypothetical protein
VGGKEITAHELRRSTDLPPKARVHVLNLHGSLGWLLDTQTQVGLKFAIDDLREAQYWDLLRSGETDLWPLVVLTDQKTRRVASWPFALAYGAFENGLTRSERWLIGGYSFSDVPVNQILRDAYRVRQTWKAHDGGVELPRTLVITTDPDTESVAATVSNVIGCPLEDLIIDPQGFPEAVDSDAWEEWCA